MDIGALAETILGFVGIVLIGWALRRAGLLAASDTRPVNAIIIYVGLPALIFRAVQPATLDTSLALVALVAWVVFALSAGAAFLASRALGLSRRSTGGFVLAAALGNTGYIGYPVALSVLGDAGLVRAIFYDVFGTVAALLLVGLVIAQRAGSPASPARRLNLFREVAAFPAVGALALALLLRPFEIPVVVGNGLDTLARLVVPLIMISVGLSLRLSGLRDHARPLALLAVVRLLFAPLVALAAGSLAFADPDVTRLVVLQAGMPSMMLALVVGARFDLDTDLIASAILVTTVASVASIPLMQVLAG